MRRISTAGTFRLHHGQPFFTQALNGEVIDLKEVRDDLWNVRYSDTLLGRFDEQFRTITGAPSLKKRLFTMSPDKVSPISPIVHSVISARRDAGSEN